MSVFEQNLARYLSCYNCEWGKRVSKTKIYCSNLGCKKAGEYEVKKHATALSISK